MTRAEVILPSDTVPLYFRPEAQPVPKWNSLTEFQQAGLLKLLRMLDECSQRSAPDHLDGERSRLPWLFAETRLQLAFIDGERGSGKTTLMTTLAGAIDDPSKFVQSGDGAQFDEVQRLIHQLKNRIIPVQPLDMEPLPKDTPILVAILARVYRAARLYGADESQRPTKFFEDPRDNRELLRLEQYRQRIAKVLDSNLRSRKALLDADQYSEAVMAEEDDRLGLVSDLEHVLSDLAINLNKRLKPSSKAEGNIIFLIPIDDVDLNPDRCLELLQLLRAFSPPRELFFLLMGQYALVETIVKLQMASDFGELRKQGIELSTVASETLKNDVAGVAGANVRKMIPPHSVIALPSTLTLSAILAFSPLGKSKHDAPAHEIPTLSNLFWKVPLRAADGSVSRYPSLGALLTASRDATEVEIISRRNFRGDFSWTEYCGLGAFQIPTRRLVDLWMDLQQLVSDINPSADGDRTAAYKVHALFETHWRRVVDADTNLSPPVRSRLLQEGPSACTVACDSGMPVERSLEIVQDGNAHSARPDSPNTVSSYRPMLRIPVDRPGAGVPIFEVIGSTSPMRGLSGLLLGERAERVASFATRCACALYHDINELYSIESKSSGSFPRLTSIDPVVTAWVGEEGDVAAYPWPLPPLTTFAEMSVFLAAWRTTSSVLLSKRRLHSSHIDCDTVCHLIEAWASLGIQCIDLQRMGDPYYKMPIPIHDWGKTLALLVTKKTQSAMTSLQYAVWIGSIVQLVQPEMCSISVSKRLIPELEKAGQAILQHTPYLHLGALATERANRLSTLLENGAQSLWSMLNPDRDVVNSQWAYLKAPTPKPEKRRKT